MNNRPIVLLIDDNPAFLTFLARELGSEASILVASSGPEGLAKADAVIPDLILLDLIMPEMSGMAVLRRLRDAGTDIPVIIITAYGQVTSAVQAIRLGAVDYLEKPIADAKLKETVRAFLSGRKRAKDLPSRQGIIGDSPQIRRVWMLIEKYGPSDLPILLCGETGTGKELFANAIHEISKQCHGPFVPVDVSTIPESLVESEVFGYEKGAFTGANGRKPGRLEWADKGTLFLDELGNLPTPFQAKLLRFLQDERYVPLGAGKAKSVSARLVSATNADLRLGIRNGTFREDLYYRVSGVTIELPPLRERKGDVELLARHFVDMYSRRYDKPGMQIADEAMELLCSHRWSGNVREVQHAIAGAVVLADRLLLPHHLALGRSAEAHDGSGAGRGVSGSSGGQEIAIDLHYRYDLSGAADLKKFEESVVTDVERFIITEARQRLCLGRTELAGFLGIDPKTLRSKLKRDADSCGR